MKTKPFIDNDKTIKSEYTFKPVLKTTCIKQSSALKTYISVYKRSLADQLIGLNQIQYLTWTKTVPRGDLPVYNLISFIKININILWESTLTLQGTSLLSLKMSLYSPHYDQPLICLV